MSSRIKKRMRTKNLQFLLKYACLVLVVPQLFLFTGCATYKPVATLSSNVTEYKNQIDQNGVTVAIKVLNDDEIRSIFKRNIHERGVQPVFIVIQNNSKSTYEFSKSTVNKPIYFPHEAAERGRYSVGWRVVWFSPFIISVFLWPLLLPALIGGAGAAEANQEMRKDYANKELPDGKIAPNGTSSGFLYFNKQALGRDLLIKVSNVETTQGLYYSFLLM